MEDKPLRFLDQSTKPSERFTDKPELPQQRFTMHMVAEMVSIEDEVHLKVGHARGLEVFSDEPRDRMVALAKNAKGGCFAENLVVQQVPLLSSVTLRGDTVYLGD